MYDTAAGDGDEDGNDSFSPRQKVQYEVYVFRKATQLPGEHLDVHDTRLRMLAEHCEFGDVANEIKSQVIQSCASSRVRKYGLREAKKTLEQLLEHGRTLEGSEVQSKGIEQGSRPTAAVNQVQRRPQKKAYQPRPGGGSNALGRNCGGEWPHRNGCPARGKPCKACGKQNHFASRPCRSKPQHTAEN